MNKEEALTFLGLHQPLPPDGQMTEDLISRYEEVRQYCLAHPTPECVPLFLNSFGEGSGFGIYQLVEDVITLFPEEDVVRHLQASLESPHYGVRYWGAQIAANFPNSALVSLLGALLANGNADERAAAATALGLIDDERVDAVLDRAAHSEIDEDVRQLLTEIIADR
jgi:hypothetical protein